MKTGAFGEDLERSGCGEGPEKLAKMGYERLMLPASEWA